MTTRKIKFKAMTITCFIKYEIDPTRPELFHEYAKTWGKAIPQCGVDLIGYYAPHEGSATTAYGVYNISSLAEYEQYRERLKQSVLGIQNYQFAKENKFILKEDRIFLKCVSTPHSKRVETTL